MSPESEIDYAALIDKTIKDFQPVKRLWPVRMRLLYWILLETAILVLTAGFRGVEHLYAVIQNAGPIYAVALCIAASSFAAFLALRSVIPGREVSWLELVLLIAVVCASLLMRFAPPGAASSGAFLQTGIVGALRFISLVAFPWVALFWAVRRGVPLQTARTGALVGLAAFCFACAVQRFNQAADFANPLISLMVPGAVITTLSAVAGGLWLNWINQWGQTRSSGEIQLSSWYQLKPHTLFPVAIAVSLVALIFVLKAPNGIPPTVPDFDLAIENYERSVIGFRPNVPSSSIGTMLTEYVERGMPAYMWDFGPEGFKFAGGRWQPLPDGTPVTYTWFRGAKRGLICMMRPTDAFKPPPVPSEEHHHQLFYRYRGFSLCLINIGGYGSFISVIAAPMPMRQFVPLVLAAVG
jgi:Negative regulator of sigma F